MDNKDQGLLEFYEYLKGEENDVHEKLKDFYTKWDERQEHHMNTYGISTPKDKILLDCKVAISELKSKISASENLESLVKELQEEITKLSGPDSLALQKQKQYIDNYYNMKKDSSSEMKR